MEHRVVAAGDHREAQAHQIAERIAPAPRPAARTRSRGVQRPAPAGPPVEHVVRGRGAPLEPGLRHEMERHFGRDLSSVHLHTGAGAGRSARDQGAVAYTAGDHIVFGAGRYAPGTAEGRHLLAHELAHVALHQTGGPGGTGPGGADGVHGPIFRQVDEAEFYERQELARSTMDFMAAVPPPMSDATVLIPWAQRHSEEFFRSDTRDRKRGYIAEGIIKVHDLLVAAEGRAKHDPDGALIEVSPFGSQLPWTPERARSLDEIPVFTPSEMARWHRAAEVFGQEPAAPRGRRGKKAVRTVKTPRGHQVEACRITNSVTFSKGKDMTTTTTEGQAEIIWLHLRVIRPGLTGDQISWLVNRLGVNKKDGSPRLTPEWMTQFENAAPGDKVTLTNDNAFEFDVIGAVTEMPNQHDIMVSAFQQGVIDSAGGLYLGLGVFGLGVIALTGGAAIGGLAALGGEVTMTGLAATGAAASEGAGLLTMAGVGARYSAQYLVLNGPALWNTASRYGGAILAGGAMGQRLYDEGLHLSNLPDYLGDAMPAFEGAFPKLPELPPLGSSGSGGTALTRRGRGGGGGGDGEWDLLIDQPKLNPKTRQYEARIVQNGQGTYDISMGETGNGSISKRGAGVVGVIVNGKITPPGSPSGSSGSPPGSPSGASPGWSGPSGTASGSGGALVRMPGPSSPAPVPVVPTRPALPPPVPAAGATPGRSWLDFMPAAIARRLTSQANYGLNPSHLNMAQRPTPPGGSGAAARPTTTDLLEQLVMVQSQINSERVRVAGVRDAAPKKMTWEPNAAGALKRTDWNAIRPGETKKLYNLLEERDVLKMRLAFPEHDFLEQVSIVGVETPDGQFYTMPGRIADWALVKNGQAFLGDRKSPSAIKSAPRGGLPVNRPVTHSDLNASFKVSRGQYTKGGNELARTQFGDQVLKERFAIRRATALGGDILIEGTDANGVRVQRRISPLSLSLSRLNPYDQLPDKIGDPATDQDEGN